MRIEIGFGVGKTRDGTPITEQQVKTGIDLIVTEACNWFGGCTIVPGRGGWRPEGGEVVIEDARSLVIDVNGDTVAKNGETVLKRAKLLAQFVRVTFDQQAVVLTILPATTHEVYA